MITIIGLLVIKYFYEEEIIIMITISGYWLKIFYEEEIIIMITTSGYWIKIFL
jgi:hypothetical protein